MRNLNCNCTHPVSTPFNAQKCVLCNPHNTRNLARNTFRNARTSSIVTVILRLTSFSKRLATIPGKTIQNSVSASTPIPKVYPCPNLTYHSKLVLIARRVKDMPEAPHVVVSKITNPRIASSANIFCSYPSHSN